MIYCGYCIKCGKELDTSCFNGVCNECRINNTVATKTKYFYSTTTKAVCSNCENVIKDTDNYCSKCGAYLKGEEIK